MTKKSRGEGVESEDSVGGTRTTGPTTELEVLRAHTARLEADLAKAKAPAPISHVKESRAQLPDAQRAAKYSRRLIADQLKLTPPGPEKKTVAELTAENKAMAARMMKLEGLVASRGMAPRE